MNMSQRPIVKRFLHQFINCERRITAVLRLTFYAAVKHADMVVRSRLFHIFIDNALINVLCWIAVAVNIRYAVSLLKFFYFRLTGKYMYIARLFNRNPFTAEMIMISVNNIHLNVMLFQSFHFFAKLHLRTKIAVFPVIQIS